MRIVLKEPGGRGFTLRFPSCMIFNYAAAMIAPPFMRKHGVNITARQAFGLIRAVNSSRHANPGWKLLEAETQSGQHVEIVL